MKNSLLKKPLLLIVFVLITLSSLCYGQKREIAITIDDLPFVGESKNFHLNLIINALKNNGVPATGFVIAKEVSAKNWKMLRKFHDAGLGLGNHTYSHLNLNKVNTQDYIREIAEADRILLPLLTEPKYFRYPYLAMSQGEKKNRILRFLNEKNYQIAPITIDSKDFLFNQILYALPEKERRGFLNTLKQFYIKFIWHQTLQAEEMNRLNHNSNQAQILLIHANLLNAYVLPDIIKLYKENGFTFISLEEALKNPSKPSLKNPLQIQSKNLKPKISKSPFKAPPPPTEDLGNLHQEWNNPDNMDDYVEWD